MTVIVTEETHKFSWQPLPSSKQLLEYERTHSGRIRIAFVPRRLEDGNKKTQVLILTRIGNYTRKHRTQARCTQDRQCKTFHRTSPHAFSIRQHHAQEQFASRIRDHGTQEELVSALQQESVE
jgi:hypothetical protein